MADTQKRSLPFGYKASAAGLLRIGVWCLFFLWLAGRLMPPVTEDIPFTIAASNSPVVPMVTIADDHRVLREDAPADRKKLNIAWISDSTGVILAPDQDFTTATEAKTHILPSFVARDLQQKYGLKNFSIRFYAQLGLRPVDNLVFALTALRDKPDLVIIPLNYMYDFNHYKVLGKNAPLPLLPGAFAGRPALWPLIPLLASPSDNLRALLGQHFDILREAVPVKRYFERAYLSATQASTAAQFDSPINDVSFWVIYKFLHGNVRPIIGNDGHPSQVLLNRTLIESSVPGAENSLATESLQNMLAVFRDSGIPVLAYMMPMGDSYYEAPKTVKAMQAINTLMAAENAKSAKTGLRIITEIPEDIRHSMTFRPADEVHILTPGNFDDYLADEIWREIERHNLNRADAP